MCGILITSGNINHAELAMSNSLISRGLPGNITHNVHGPFEVTHWRLPLQRSSKPQPIKIDNSNVYFVGEYYETVSDEIPELSHRLHKGDWLCDWEGDLFEINEDHLIIKVDPLRKRPLYFYQGTTGMVLSSSLSLFLGAIRSLDITLDYTYLDMIKRQKVIADLTRTPFNEVKCLLPGDTAIQIDIRKLPSGGHSHTIYSNTQRWNYVNNGSEAAEPDLMKIIVRRVSHENLTKDYGVLLSGGLDSSLILHVISELRPNDIIKCYVADKQLSQIEVHNIGLLKEKYNIKILGFDIWNTPPLEDKFNIMGSPMDLGSVGTQIGLAKALKDDNLHVAISGDGADEFFGGYKRNLYSDYRHHDIFMELVGYHHPRLDQIMLGHTIELRNPLSALPLLEYAMNLPWNLRKNKVWLRQEAGMMGLDPDICYTKKIALKSQDIQEDSLTMREQSVDRFIEYFNNKGSVQ